MNILLPKLGKRAIELEHFPTKHQAFIYRAYEYVPPAKIARILRVEEEKVISAAQEMGLNKPCNSDIWLEKGYITIIRRLWHILPYEQLMELLEMDKDTLGIILREEDFLDIKLGHKPVCDPVCWCELTAEEAVKTKKIKAVMEELNTDGVAPFDFQYHVQDMKLEGNPSFDIRMVYGFSGLYQHAFDVDSRTYCPDEMLEAYQKVGINAIWTQGILYQLTEFPFYKKISEGYEKRLDRLKDFVERCDKYGIKVYLYLNEPRNMPENFFEKYPKMKGHNAKDDKVCMCTSTKEVQKYLTDSVEFLCRQVPGIGGFFTITRSENPTNCYSHSTKENCTCPRCSMRSESEVIAEVIGCIEKGAHKVDKNIKVIAWSWAWNEFNIDIINALPDNVIVMSKSEGAIPFCIGGIEGKVSDYSMSIVGPGEEAKAEWRAAKARGLETAAKVQINTTWEGSTTPAVPVYPLIEEHIRKIKEEGVRNLMLSWTVGGYPSENIMYAAKYFYEKYDPSALNDSELKRQASAIFAEAFREFPFHLNVLYKGPQNAGPSNLLFMKPTGYTATMTCYAYDDLETWKAIYPIDVFESQWEKLCSKWKEGLDLLDRETDELSEFEVMAHSAYCLFWASYNQVRFYRARETGNKKAMVLAVKDEIDCAKKMLNLMNQNAAIGYEAANHYYFSKGSICEKLVNCYDVLNKLTE